MGDILLMYEGTVSARDQTVESFDSQERGLAQGYYLAAQLREPHVPGDFMAIELVVDSPGQGLQLRFEDVRRVGSTVRLVPIGTKSRWLPSGA